MVSLTSGVEAPIFLFLGLVVCMYRSFKPLLGNAWDFPDLYPIASALIVMFIDLATLLIIQQGLNQAKAEIGRGSWLGAGIGLLVVTPLLCFLTRGLLKLLARGVSSSR